MTNQNEYVFLMSRSYLVEGGRGVAEPLLMKTREPEGLLPVGFSCKELADNYIKDRNLGTDVWCESGTNVITRCALHFRHGKVVFFDSQESIDRFNEQVDIPIKRIENGVQHTTGN